MDRGYVLKKLRQMSGDGIKVAAKKLNKSPGWLSEVENNRGNSRLSDEDFEMLIKFYDGAKHRKRFHRWAEPKPKKQRKTAQNDGAALRYLREKKGLSLTAAAKSLGVTKGYLSNIELSRAHLSEPFKAKAMKLYGFSIGSFRNFTGNEKGRCTPAKYRLPILLKSLGDQDLEQIYELALKLAEKPESIDNTHEFSA